MLSRSFISGTKVCGSMPNSNLLIQMQTFGFSFRKHHGLYSFKLTKNKKFKNTHAMSLSKKLQLKAMGYEGELRIKDTERASQRPFGKVDQKGRFKFSIDKVPFYNIPDLTGFDVSPRSAMLTTI